jgi:hypothetical protein
MTRTEFVFLVWNTDRLYNGDPAGEDVLELLDRIGAPYGFNVDEALENYAAPQRKRLSEFMLEPRT